MRLKEPRIQPLTDDELKPEHNEALERLPLPFRSVNLFRTSVRAPVAMKTIMLWSKYLGNQETCSLPWRQRELIVLRTAFLCMSGYEWSHHTYLGRQAGLEKEEVAALRDAVDNHEWNFEDQVILNAISEIVSDSHISDKTWKELSSFYSEKQVIDLIYTVGHYQMASAYANSLGIQIDDGVSLDDGLSKFDS